MRDESLVVVRVSVETELADAVADRLWGYAPDAVSETAQGGWTTFVAGYPTAAAARAAHGALAAQHSPELEPAPAADDWVRTWRAGEASQRVEPFHLRLPEHDAIPGLTDLVIEPGATFGFSHPSTLLALELLAGLDLAGRTVADVGCGSGVLAVAAALAGASRVDAVDIDPAAIVASDANAAANAVAVTAATGSIDALPHPSYDIVVANLLAGTLVRLADDIVSATDPAGAIVLSGLLAADEARIAGAFAARQVETRLEAGEWLALRLR